MSFDDHAAAIRFKQHLEQAGPDKARAILGVVDTPTHVETITTWCDAYITGLTGVEEATRNRYRAYVTRDLATIGATPLFAVDEQLIAGWVNTMQADGASGKTIANKHGFLAGALKVAVRRGLLPANPCENTRLPSHDREEMCFLTVDEFAELRDAMTERWRPLATFLVTTGCRFSEATALQVGDVNVAAGTIRISRAWKYTGNAVEKLGGPKSRKSRRTINIPPQALEAMGDLSDRKRTELVFTTQRDTRVKAQLFHNKAWRPALSKAGLNGKRPRPHDLRHTCASWMIAAGVPLPVIQAHFGHESITTTIGTYGHLDRSSSEAASAAIGAALQGI
ncbi:tyrosine-type recombinase/integrase [Rhodococcoides kroppenstedtii]|nr:site-specific integrase [Rhodococcus kroppenstedtii]